MAWREGADLWAHVAIISPVFIFIGLVLLEGIKDLFRR